MREKNLSETPDSAGDNEDLMDGKVIFPSISKHFINFQQIDTQNMQKFRNRPWPSVRLSPTIESRLEYRITDVIKLNRWTVLVQLMQNGIYTDLVS